ncbi:major facilitator superfamily domain-containing protein 6-like [Montipora foliosa]|uniref:major facilitator superfamily domain-containing protein 6-like n=1 Tax=Montipora foliosa TaxID=591990 RepID=UPI0035F1E156
MKRFIAQTEVHLARIDKPLLVFKLFYFFFFGSLATTFPFLPSYFTQIGFSPYQVGVLSSVRPLVQLFAAPLWGFSSDRCFPKKRMIQFCSFVWLIGTISLAFVEPTGQMCQLVSLNDTDSKVVNSTEMQTGFFRRRRTTDFLLMQSKRIPRNEETNDVESTEVTIGSGSGNSQPGDSDMTSGSGITTDSLYLGKLKITKQNKTKDAIPLPSPSNLKSSFKSSTPDLIELNFTTRNELRENISRLYNIFLGALALVIFEETFLCPVLFVIDAILLAKQAEDNSVVYGRQRCFGSIGFLLFFLITGTLVNNSQRPVCGHIYADYIINFCFFCVMTIVTLLVLVRFELPCRVPVESPYERLKANYYNKHYGSFLAAVAFMGFSHTVIPQFHASLLTQANVEYSTFAVINTFLLLGKPLGFFIGHKLIYYLGSINLLFASLVLYMLNHFACSFVSSPWHVIPLGFIEGFTFSSSFVVCVTYLASSSPLDYITTIQGIFHSIYWGLGGFIGIVIGGGLIRVAGPTTAFRLFTMLAVVFIALFTMGLRYVNLRDRNYYSVLLSTFNNCVDSTNTEQKCDNSTNNTSQENDAKVQSPSSASFSLEFLGNS